MTAQIDSSPPSVAADAPPMCAALAIIFERLQLKGYYPDVDNTFEQMACGYREMLNNASRDLAHKYADVFLEYLRDKNGEAGTHNAFQIAFPHLLDAVPDPLEQIATKQPNKTGVNATQFSDKTLIRAIELLRREKQFGAQLAMYWLIASRVSSLKPKDWQRVKMTDGCLHFEARETQLFGRCVRIEPEWQNLISRFHRHMRAVFRRGAYDAEYKSAREWCAYISKKMTGVPGLVTLSGAAVLGESRSKFKFIDIGEI